MADKWLTPSEVASRLGVSPDTVRKWIRKGKLKARKEGDRYWINPNDIPTPSRPHPEQHSDQELISVLRDRIRELEQDKAFLLEQLKEKDRQIADLSQLVDRLTLTALPAPQKTLRERLRALFKRGS